METQELSKKVYFNDLSLENKVWIITAILVWIGSVILWYMVHTGKW